MRNKTKLFWLLLVIAIFGCADTAGKMDQADRLARQSVKKYQEAVKDYREIFTRAKNKSVVQLRLGTLYFKHNDFDLAAGALKSLSDPAAQKMLAISQYKLGNYTDALEVFNRLGERGEADFLYFYGLTCEKQNLFDQAKRIYLNIKTPPFLSLAQKRIQEIDSQLQMSTGDPRIIKLLTTSPGEKEYPQAGAIILDVEENMAINPDNTETVESYVLIKILNERGRKFAEVDMDYDSTYEKAELVFARTIKPNGEVVKVGAKHIRDVSRYMDFPLYSNARALIVSMPEVADGSIIEYKVRVKRNKLIADKEFNLAYTLQEDEPVLLAKLTVIVPQDREINILKLNEEFNSFNAQLDPKVSSVSGKKIYYWEFKNIPQIIPEPMMPPASEITPGFIISSFKSWDQIYKWWWPLAKDKMDINPEMKQKVKELIAGKSSPEGKARAVYNWCIKNIRYVGIEYGQAGYEPHRATEIFANKYGDCKDQAILLISLFKEAGIEAYPVLIGTKGTFKLEEKLPAALFNHCIVAARVDQDLIFLDPTGETVSFGDLPSSDQARKVLVFFKDRGEIISTIDFPAEHNRIKRSTYIKINSDETIEATREIYTFGYYDQIQHWKFKYTRPILIEESLKEAVHQIVPGGKLLEYKIDNVENMDESVRLFYRFSGPNYLVRAGKARVISGGSVDTSLAAKERRNYDIDFDALMEEEAVTTIELPENFTVKFLPETLTQKTKWAEIVNDYNLKDNKIVLTSRSTQKKKTVSREEYSEFRKSLQDLAEKSKQCIILEKIKDGPAK